jgi:hypothetical protein
VELKNREKERQTAEKDTKNGKLKNLRKSCEKFRKKRKHQKKTNLFTYCNALPPRRSRAPVKSNWKPRTVRSEARTVQLAGRWRQCLEAKKLENHSQLFFLRSLIIGT